MRTITEKLHGITALLMKSTLPLATSKFPRRQPRRLLNICLYTEMFSHIHNCLYTARTIYSLFRALLNGTKCVPTSSSLENRLTLEGGATVTFILRAQTRAGRKIVKSTPKNSLGGETRGTWASKI